ncbi:MAG: ATP-dependent DNA helicase RecG [Phycisphaera sp.]|nr:ATP-dependent DNA helicase RecG [Phycisphaera sp.]
MACSPASGERRRRISPRIHGCVRPPRRPARVRYDVPDMSDTADPTSAGSLTLGTPIQYAPGVGARRAQLFAKLGVRTIADLIKHIPHRYEYHAGQTPILDLPIGQIATARGVVVNCRWAGGMGGGRGRGGGGRFTAQIRDDHGFLDLVWFNARYMRDKVHPGMTMIVTGKVALYNDQRQMANPKFVLMDEDDEAAADTDNVDPKQATLAPGDGGDGGDGGGGGGDKWSDERYRPIYPATEALPTGAIERIIEDLLPTALPQIDDHFDDAYRAERDLPTLADAYRMLHQPADEDEVKRARRRLAYDELLLLQLGFAMKRKHVQTELSAPPLRWSDAIDEHIRERFPFKLTKDQDTVVRELAADLQKPIPMNRLLQGDVGSGKTVVALYAMLMAVSSNTQAALMAPTELLAEQHFLSISRMLDGSTVRIALLTGSLSKPERTALLYKIERGEVDIVIGTQALISETVQFNDLAVVVVDEQHRFGVVQRAVIKSKAGDETRVPHTLVMTATPIPRTLSLTIFGDLDVSTIRHLPPGRQPIATRVVAPDKEEEVYGYIAERVRAGEQAYVVLPAIDESESGLKAVRSHAAELEKTWFAGLNVATVHGQLKRITRERIMQRFRDAKLDVLVATTVIEVGVDVPNASIMVVEHAERFGLAQLHQLRGRVGRGERKSLCVFIADPTTDDAAARMKAIARTTDGFKIAEADLEIRGMGELLGTRQSGLPPLKVADLTKHMELLALANRDAHTMIDADPKLTDASHDLLRKRLVKQYGEALGLADVA